MHSSSSKLIIFFFFFITIFNFPLSISIPFFPTKNITLYGDAYFINNAISLTQQHPCPPPSSISSIGSAFFVYPIRFLESKTNSTLSFSSRFSFSITPSPHCSNGDGIAFLIASNLGSFSQEIGHLGLPQLGQESQDSFIAVEFDTNLNPNFGDINGNHVGIDIDSCNSVVSVDGFSSGVDFSNGLRITAWIEYRNSEKMFRVWVGYDPVRPINPVLSAQIDLSNHMKEFMHVGFSASNGNGSAMHVVDRWRFKTFELDFIPGSTVSLDSIEGGNCVICPQDYESFSPKQHDNTIWIYPRKIRIVIPAGVVALLLLLFISICCFTNVVMKKGPRKIPNIELEKGPQKFSLKEIKLATGKFSKNRIIGQGASATVYKGIFPDGKTVAVKRFNHFSKIGHVNPFTTEFATMARCLSHKNLVRLLGWCCESKELVLIYEFLPNGSLDQILYKSSDSVCVLTWEQRLNIVLGIASGLTYLHEECDRQIIHRDVKTCNIMLDSDFTAKLGDFGLAEVYDRKSKSRTSTIPAGTMGYLAPEYVYLGVPTVKSDVYSFGVVVLEVVSGKRPVDDDGSLLVDRVWGLWEKGKLIEAVDHRFMGKYSRVDMERMLKVGLCCVHSDCEKRPTVKEAAMMLRDELELPLLPVNRPSVKLGSLLLEDSRDLLDDIQESPWLTPKTHFDKD